MKLLEQITKAINDDKIKILGEKESLLEEIRQFVKDVYEQEDNDSLVEIREFITNKQSYFGRTYAFAPPNIIVDGKNLSILSPISVKEAYQNSIDVNKDFQNESEKIYESLLPED